MRGRRMRHRPGIVLGVAAIVAAALTLSGTRLAASQSSMIVAMRAPGAVPWQEPWDSFWDDVPMVDLPLSAQQVVAPKGGGRFTLRAGAVHDADRVFVVLEWPDATPNRSMERSEDFTDAAAVQFPARAGVGVPAICMGAPDAAVNIWQWRAAWQSDVESGVAGSVAGTYPRTVVDEYPFRDEDVFYPARALGNPFSDPQRASAVDNLVAGGFGTLTADPLAAVTGWGDWRDGTWRVVLSRALRVGREGSIELGLETPTDLAFAVWDGGARERDGMKSVSAFARLRLVPTALQTRGNPAWWLLLILLLAPLAVWLGLRAGRGGA